MAINAEGSITNARGQVRHFSQKAFVKLAGDPTRCFVCGIASPIRTFNNEHVIPDWLLRRFSLHSKRITLPNGYQTMYGRYTLRCCEACNGLLGERVEDVISRLFEDDAHSMVRSLSGAATLLYQWLCLLFIKLHLKDREIRIDPDVRSESSRLGEIYDWDGLHHIHSVARAPHSGAEIDNIVLGTIFLAEMKLDGEPFDFGTFSDYSTIMVRIGRVGIACVLNDCGFVSSMVGRYLAGISGPLSAIQLREVAARLAYGNSLLKNRPLFWTEADADSLRIRARPPASRDLDEVDRSELCQLIAFSCGPLLLRSKTPCAEEKLGQLQRGEIQFLYYADGTFIRD